MKNVEMGWDLLENKPGLVDLHGFGRFGMMRLKLVLKIRVEGFSPAVGLTISADPSKLRG